MRNLALIISSILISITCLMPQETVASSTTCERLCTAKNCSASQAVFNKCQSDCKGRKGVGLCIQAGKIAGFDSALPQTKKTNSAKISTQEQRKKKQSEEEGLKTSPDDGCSLKCRQAKNNRALQEDNDEEDMGLKSLFADKPQAKRAQLKNNRALQQDSDEDEEEEEDMGLKSLFADKPQAKRAQPKNNRALQQDSDEDEEKDMGLKSLFADKPQAKRAQPKNSRMTLQKSDEEEDMGLKTMFDNKVMTELADIRERANQIENTNEKIAETVLDVQEKLNDLGSCTITGPVKSLEKPESLNSNRRPSLIDKEAKDQARTNTQKAKLANAVKARNAKGDMEKKEAPLTKNQKKALEAKQKAEAEKGTKGKPANSKNTQDAKKKALAKS